MRDFGPKIAVFFTFRGEKSPFLLKIESDIEAYIKDKYLRKPKQVKVSL